MPAVRSIGGVSLVGAGPSYASAERLVFVFVFLWGAQPCGSVLFLCFFHGRTDELSLLALEENGSDWDIFYISSGTLSNCLVWVKPYQQRPAPGVSLFFLAETRRAFRAKATVRTSIPWATKAARRATVRKTKLGEIRRSERGPPGLGLLEPWGGGITGTMGVGTCFG